MKRLAIFTDQDFEAVSNRLTHLAQAKMGNKQNPEVKKLNQAVAQYEKRQKMIALFCTSEMLRVRL